MKDKMCVCGDTESQHIDNEVMCVVPDCGCKEFIEQPELPLYPEEQEAGADLPKCPECGAVLKEIWDNQGWNGDDGPRHDEVVGYECPTHGDVEPAKPEPDADLINETFMENGKEALMEKGMSEEEAEASVREQMGLE